MAPWSNGYNEINAELDQLQAYIAISINGTPFKYTSLLKEYFLHFPFNSTEEELQREVCNKLKTINNETHLKLVQLSISFKPLTYQSKGHLLYKMETM